MAGFGGKLPILANIVQHVIPFRSLREFTRGVITMDHTSAATKESVIVNKRGFTLIELLVVFAVIGILTAIAIPQFFAYRMRAIDSQMKSDIKNVALAMENYYSEKFIYPTTIAEITPFGFRQTQGVNLAINLTPPTNFTVTASKSGGTQPSFTYDSNTGQTN